MYIYDVNKEKKAEAVFLLQLTDSTGSRRERLRLVSLLFLNTRSEKITKLNLRQMIVMVLVVFRHRMLVKNQWIHPILLLIGINIL